MEQLYTDFDVVSSKVVVSTAPVPSDDLLEVEAAYISARGKYGLWSITEEVFTTADDIPPGVVTSPAAVGGVAQATFSWTSPNSSNYSGSRLYWNVANDFATATLESPPEYGAPSTADSRTITGISPGTRYGWIVAFNRSDVAAAPVATGSFVVT